ncbi:MAG TPA: hypothetical protein VF796_17065, partial [Humisphaera sp.]
MTHLLLASILAAGLAALALAKPRAGMAVTLVYLAALGDIRRFVTFHSNPVELDPLLLVGSLVMAALAVRLYQEGQFRPDTRLASAITVLLAVMGLQIFNPAQGGLAVGFGGVLFYVVPLMWYWAGRTYGSLTFAEAVVRRVVVPVAVAAAVLGLYQTFVGFPAYQQRWIDLVRAQYVALNVAGSIRPFGCFTSSVEYAQWLGIAVVAPVCLALGGRPAWAALAAVPLVVVSLFLQGSRGVLVGTLFASAIGWSLRSASARAWVPRLLVAVVVAAFGLRLALSEAVGLSVPEQVSAVVERQQAIFDPFNQERSTASSHLLLKMSAFEGAIQT